VSIVSCLRSLFLLWLPFIFRNRPADNHQSPLTSDLSGCPTSRVPVLSDVASIFDETLRTNRRSRRPGGRLRASSNGGAKEEGTFESSLVRSAGLRFFKSDPVADGTIDGHLCSRKRLRDQEPSFSIVPSGRNYLRRHFPALRTATFKCPSGTDFSAQRCTESHQPTNHQSRLTNHQSRLIPYSSRRSNLFLHI